MAFWRMNYLDTFHADCSEPQSSELEGKFAFCKSFLMLESTAGKIWDSGSEEAPSILKALLLVEAYD